MIDDKYIEEQKRLRDQIDIEIAEQKRKRKTRIEMNRTKWLERAKKFKFKDEGKKIHLNTRSGCFLKDYIPISEVTEEDIEKEVEFGFNNNL